MPLVHGPTESMTVPQAPSIATRPVASLRPNSLNPRGDVDGSGLEELAASIQSQGVLQPLLITTRGIVVAGHRRLAAARMAGLVEVPVVVRDLDPVQQQEIMLVENLQRQDLSAIEEARAYRRLLEAGQTTAQLARRVGAPSARINARLVLLKLDDQVQSMFHRGDLPLTLAPVLVRVSDSIRQRRIATMAARRRLSVAEIERIVERGIGALRTAPPTDTLPPDEPQKQGLSPSRVVALDALAERASESLSLGDLADLFETTCCACGASDLPTYCSACPMLDLVNRVLARVERR
jgi:ParB family transcriptional regulator, chromosome partitioning protein